MAYTITSRRFTSVSNKFSDFENMVKIPRAAKSLNVGENSYLTNMMKYNKDKDTKHANKNKRKPNKDYKDFMNSQ